MATQPETVEFILDQLADLDGVRTRKMFGEYALYCRDKVVGLICDGRLFVKITAEGKAVVGDTYAEAPAYPGAKPSIAVAADVLEDADRLTELIRLTAEALPAPKPRKRKKSARR
jgi:DNA transformation protein